MAKPRRMKTTTRKSDGDARVVGGIIMFLGSLVFVALLTVAAIERSRAPVDLREAEQSLERLDGHLDDTRGHLDRAQDALRE